MENEQLWESDGDGGDLFTRNAKKCDTISRGIRHWFRPGRSHAGVEHEHSYTTLSRALLGLLFARVCPSQELIASKVFKCFT